jgi:hypothetical protein
MELTDTTSAVQDERILYKAYITPTDVRVRIAENERSGFKSKIQENKNPNIWLERVSLDRRRIERLVL